MKKLLIFICVAFISISIHAADPTGQVFVDASRPDDSGAGTSWATAKKTIGAGITVAYNNAGAPNYWSQIFVAQGTYIEFLNPSSSYVTNLYGGFPTGGGTFSSRNPKLYQTIISGNGATGATRLVSLGNSYVFDGFIVENYTYSSNSTGGSALQFKGTNGIVSNCVFRKIKVNVGNTTAIYGFSPIQLETKAANQNNPPKMINCEIYGNSNVTTNTKLNGGGAITIVKGGYVINCKIYNNSVVNTNPITGTTGGSGAAIMVSNKGATTKMFSHIKIINNLIYNNTSKEGSAICMDFTGMTSTYAATDSLIYVTNNTIANNVATNPTSGKEGIMTINYPSGAMNPAQFLVSNNILWGNKAGSSFSQLTTTQAAFATVTNNAIQGDITGLDVSNISLDEINANATGPKFQSPSNIYGCSIDGAATNDADSVALETADWTLGSTSTCINAGNNSKYASASAGIKGYNYNSYAIITPTDFSGTARIKNTTIDMGAYEVDNVSTITNNPIHNEILFKQMKGCIVFNSKGYGIIYNSSGNQIWSGDFQNQQVSLTQGIYIIKYSSNNFWGIKKFVID